MPELDDDCIAHLLGYQAARTNALMREVFRDAIGERHALRPVEFTILCLLLSNTAVTQKRLGAALLIRAPNLTVILDRLQHRGLVRRVRSDSDRRAIRVELTDAGLALSREALADSQAMEGPLIDERLDPAERAQLFALLDRLLSARPTRR